MMLNHEHFSLANLRVCDTIALGSALKVLREFEITPRTFYTTHPELWCVEIPAAPFRAFIASAS